MRVIVLFAVFLTGCVGFNPRLGGAGPGPAEAADAADASAASPSWAASARAPEWQAIGYSWEGRPLRVTQVGSGPRRVLWIGGIHGNEREGQVATRELPGALQAFPGLTDEVTLILLEDCNPDGAVRGTRGNAQGVDLNRNYPAPNFRAGSSFGARPLDQPEARALHDLVLREQPDLVIVLHSWGGDHFINYDGPARELAERFSELSGYRVKESDTIHPTPGSLGSWVGNTLHIPILTLEYLRGRDPESAWRETRSAILAVIRSG